jgi:ribonuclease T2
MRTVLLFLLTLFPLFASISTPIKPPSHLLLALSWHNAFCETHRYKKECKRDFTHRRGSTIEESFVLHGLWPQPRSNTYCQVGQALVKLDKKKQWSDLPCLPLNAKVERELKAVMPGFASQLHKHEWIKHGTCYSNDPNRYFEDSIMLTKQFNASAVGRLFTTRIGQRVTLKEIRSVANKEFGRGAGERIELRCKRGLITEVWLHLGDAEIDLGTMLKKGNKVRSRCREGRIDRAGFER